MRFSIAPEHLDVIGSNCTVQEIAEAMEDLKSLPIDERYDIYSELFREGWATDAGYILLPDLWKSLSDTTDTIDLEITFVIGSIQNSVISDRNVGSYQEIVNPYIEQRCLKKTIALLEKGRPFCSPNLPEDRCDALSSVLSAHCLG
jgi:hypothetical protein